MVLWQPILSITMCRVCSAACSGDVTGNEVLTPMKVGDIAVIPAGIPHGWTNITTEVTYLSVRPDPKYVLPKAPFVYPGLK